MLDIAFKYENEVKLKLLNTWYDPKFKYYHCSVYHDVYKINENDGDWNCRRFVSLNSNKDIIGLIEYNIDRPTEVAHGLSAINFSDDKFTFGMDLTKIIDDIFCKFKIRKLEFSVVVGNPIEQSYDRMAEKYGGHIVGVLRQHYRLIDGEYYDKKMYEIFRDDYIKAKNRHIIQ